MQLGLRYELTFVFLFPGISYLMEAAQFKKCYNTSVDTHCFDTLYDDANNRWLSDYFDNSRRRCSSLNSTLLIIKDEETNEIVKQFLEEPDNPVRSWYIWSDAFRVNDYNNTYTWHWVDSTLPTVPGSDFAVKPNNSNWYVAVVAFRNNIFSLTASEPSINNNYICEYGVSSCSSISSSKVGLRQFDGRCYVAFNESVSWYDARNRCLKNGGDLASFVNVRGINFSSWLRSDPNVSYWIGLRFSWYIWIDTGEKVTYGNWFVSGSDGSPSCVVVFDGFDSVLSPMDCSTFGIIVCHTVTPLVKTVGLSTTESITESTIESVTKSSISVGGFSSVRTFGVADGVSSRDYISLGIGLGIGLGVPLVIVTTLVLVLSVKYRRLATQLKTKPSKEINELSSVQEQNVGQANESTNSQYQQLNRNLDNSSGAMYDKLRAVKPAQNYEEFPSAGT